MTKTTIDLLKQHKKNLQQEMESALDRLKSHTKHIEEYQHEIVLDRKAVDECAWKIAQITQDLG